MAGRVEGIVESEAQMWVCGRGGGLNPNTHQIGVVGMSRDRPRSLGLGAEEVGLGGAQGVLFALLNKLVCWE